MIFTWHFFRASIVGLRTFGANPTYTYYTYTLELPPSGERVYVIPNPTPGRSYKRVRRQSGIVSC